MQIISSDSELDFADILDSIDEIQRIGDPVAYQIQLQDFAMDLRAHKKQALEMLGSYENALEISDEQPSLLDPDDPELAELLDEPVVEDERKGLDALFRPLTKKDIIDSQQMNSVQRTLEIVKKVRQLVEKPLN